MSLARQADHILATKGQRTVRLDLKDERVPDEQLRPLLLGPTGNLRAPAVFVGRTLLIGFDDEQWRDTIRTG